jgi:hypothetical protein
MRTFIWRFLLVTLGPPIVVYAFFERLVVEIGEAFRSAWLEARQEAAELSRWWNV